MPEKITRVVLINKNLDMKLDTIIDGLMNEGIIPNKAQTSLSFGTKDECKKHFETIFKAVDRTVKEFVYYKEYDQIIDWMADNKGKGLALFGSVGTGKSVFIRSVLPVLFRIQYNKNLKVIGLTDFITMCPEDFRHYLDRTMIGIDELGREPLATEWGVKFEAVPIIIEGCEGESKLLFITSNATRSDIVKRYGAHTMDRINKLCKIITIKQTTLRK